MRSTGAQRRRRPIGMLAVQSAAVLVSAALLLLGVLGFVPVVTTDLDALTFTGPQSGARLFGIFEVTVLHNLIHIAFGVAGLVLARTFARARAFLLTAGVVYVGLSIWGLLIGPGSHADVVGLNNADNWLHLALGVTMIVFALTLAATRVPTDARGKALLPPSG